MRQKLKAIVGAISGHGDISRKSRWQLYPQSVPPGCEGSRDVKLPGSVFPQSFTTLILIITFLHGLALIAKSSVHADTSFSLTEELPRFCNLLHSLHHQLFRSIYVDNYYRRMIFALISPSQKPTTYKPKSILVIPSVSHNMVLEPYMILIAQYHAAQVLKNYCWA